MTKSQSNVVGGGGGGAAKKSTKKYTLTLAQRIRKSARERMVYRKNNPNAKTYPGSKYQRGLSPSALNAAASFCAEQRDTAVQHGQGLIEARRDASLARQQALVTHQRGLTHSLAYKQHVLMSKQSDLMSKQSDLVSTQHDLVSKHMDDEKDFRRRLTRGTKRVRPSPSTASSDGKFTTPPPRRPVFKSPQTFKTQQNHSEHVSNDPLLTTYGDLYKYLLEQECQGECAVVPYMERQPQLDQERRAGMVNWLIELHLKFDLAPETLYVAVKLIDRFLSKFVINDGSEYPLLGVCCLLIASKFNDLSSQNPKIGALAKECCNVIPDCCSEEKIINGEKQVLGVLRYRVMVPTSHSFLARASRTEDGHVDRKVEQLSSYLLESTLLWYNLAQYPPSKLAAAVVYIARRTVGRNGWTPTVLKSAWDDVEDEIICIARQIWNEKHNNDPNWLTALNEKHSISDTDHQLLLTVDLSEL